MDLKKILLYLECLSLNHNVLTFKLKKYEVHTHTLLVLCLLICSFSLLGQDVLNTEIPLSTANLDANQSDRYQKVANQSTVESITVMEFGNFESVQENGKVKFHIPDVGFTGTFKASYIKSSDNGDFYWYGPMEEDCEQDDPECGEIDEGLLSLIRRNGETTGTLRFNDDQYEIHDLGAGKNILVKKNFENKNLRCGNNSEESSGELEEYINSNPNSNISATTRNFNNCPVRVLALFTPAAQAAVANIQNTITLSIEESSQALRNSGVTECELELILADIQPIGIAGFVESPLMRNDREDFITSMEVLEQRNDAEADIVLVYAENAYLDFLGLAGTLFLQEERALSVITASEANTNYLTAHEIAHLFACRHEIEADNTGAIEHAHEFKAGGVFPFRKKRRTVMWSESSCKTIHHFSNPNVHFKKKPTGVEDEKENYQLLENNACVVAGFRGDAVTPPLSVAIDAPGFNCPCTSTGLSSQVNGGGIGVYQYEWRTSLDGFNWGNVVSTSSGFSLISPCIEGEVVFIRLTVTSSDGQVLDAYKAIESAYEWNGQDGACIRTEGENTNSVNGKNRLRITPNPVNDVLNVEVMLDNPALKLLQVLDIRGKVIYNQEIEIPIGISRFTIPVTNFPSGIYLIHIEGQKATKFIKL